MRRSHVHERFPYHRRAAVAVTALLVVASLGLVTSGAASAAGAGYVASLIQTPVPGALLAVDSATDSIYLAGNSGVVVVDGTTGSVTTTIATASTVYAIAADPATNTVYVATSPSTGPEIEVINGATNAVTSTISLPGIISSLAVDTTTDTVYAAEEQLDEVAVINGATNAVTTNISTGSGVEPFHLAVDETSDTVWVTVLAGSLIAIDGATNAVSSDIALSGMEPYSVAVDESTDTVYVSDPKNDLVDVLDGSTGKTSTLIAIGQAVYGVDVDQSSGLVYASSFVGTTGTTWVINGSANEIQDSSGRGSIGVVVDQSTGAVYEPAVRVAAIWILTPGTANAMSPVITSASGAGFTVGDSGPSFTPTASALPAASFSETGPLPGGLTMNANGVISGTPAAGTGGLYPITITASNGVAPDYAQQFDLSNYQAPAITSGDSATFQVGTAGSFSLTGTGYTAPSFTYSGTLPAGLSITDQTPGGWEISGTPAVGSGGVYPLTILAYNGVLPEAQQAFTLTVKGPPSFKSAAHATFVARKSGSFQVTANGYPAPTYTEVGALPSGVSLSSAGLLAGKPGADSGGVYPITITASNGLPPSADQTFRLTVDQAPAFTSARSATFKANRLRRFTVRTTGFPVATLSERGRLPAGVKFRVKSHGKAVLEGRASRADRGKTYVITITARNGVGAAVHQTFRLKVS